MEISRPRYHLRRSGRSAGPESRSKFLGNTNGAVGSESVLNSSPSYKCTGTATSSPSCELTRCPRAVVAAAHTDKRTSPVQLRLNRPMHIDSLRSQGCGGRTAWRNRRCSGYLKTETRAGRPAVPGPPPVVQIRQLSLSLSLSALASH